MKFVGRITLMENVLLVAETLVIMYSLLLGFFLVFFVLLLVDLGFYLTINQKWLNEIVAPANTD